MSKTKAIVYRVFEQVAEEEDLFSVKEKSLLAGVYATVDKTQVKILEGIIYSRAQRLNCGATLLREVFTFEYKIDDLEDLPRQKFDDAVMYLSEFAGLH